MSLVAWVILSLQVLIHTAILSYVVLLVLGLTKKVGWQKWVVLPIALTIANDLWELFFFNSTPGALFLLVSTTLEFLVVSYIVAKFYWKLDQKDAIKYSVVYMIVGYIVGYLLNLINFPY